MCERFEIGGAADCVEKDGHGWDKVAKVWRSSTGFGADGRSFPALIGDPGSRPINDTPKIGVKEPPQTPI